MKIDSIQLEFIDYNLRQLAVAVENAIGVEFTVTSIYRDGDTGVHGTMPVRGLDWRMRNIAVGKEVADLINSVCQYDPTRPELKCAVLHGRGSNLHLHLQVHPNSKRLDDV